MLPRTCAAAATAALLLTAAAVATSSPASASPASTTIGAVSEIAAGKTPEGVTGGLSFVQNGLAPGRGTFSVPAGYSVLTSWSHRTGATGGALTFTVYRPTSTAHQYLVVGSDTETVTPNTTSTFPVRILVQPGDVLGLSSQDENLDLSYTGTDVDTISGTFSAPASPGTTSTMNATFNDLYLDVAATVEADADGDGYGDATQDQCPSDATTHAACAAPDTTLVKGPAKKVKTHGRKAKVSLTFSATLPGSTFQCSVDGGAFTACASPFTAKYKLGKHTVQVRAVSATGSIDPTPAATTFKVKKAAKHHGHHH